ncbi:hypothetical protein [Agromyces subbeticus]|uniref:hypothetical protein n=1 Tax=Agromyces subbeticus TaxID=293890 RepID=UPI0012EBFF91|nr:hypothetical protein [Agromyces subbeticus]
MSDSDYLISALTGTPATAERADAAERHLVMLRPLLGEVRERWPVILPAGAAGWRSTAAERYLERLAQLRSALAAVELALAAGETELEACIAGIRAELAEHEAAVRAEEQRALDLQSSSDRHDASHVQRADLDGAAAWATR